jgi:hypothetical protein
MRGSGAVMLFFWMMSCFLGGCANMGNKLDTNIVNTIQKGVTTRVEVEAKLGPPTHVSLLSDGRRQAWYTYSTRHGDALSYVPYANYFVGGVVSQNQNLQIVYRDNIVQDYEFTDTSEHTTGGFLNQHGKAVPTSDKDAPSCVTR